MSNPRRRAQLPAEERAHLEAFEARVTWEPLLRFDDSDDSDDEPPFAHGNSLMDAEHLAYLAVDHSLQWSGGVRFTISDGTNEVKFMLHSRQLETLIEAIGVWNRGGTQDWLEARRTQ